MISHTASARCAAVRGGPASTAGPHHQRARPAPALLARPAHPSPPPARPPARRSPVARAEAEEGSGSASPSSSNADVGTQGVPGLEARAAAAVAVSAFPADLARPGEGGEGVEDGDRSAVQKFLYPDAADLPDDFAMPIWDHLDELRERVLVAAGAATLAVGLCFAAARDLVIFLEAPVAAQGVRFLQLSPGEFFFTTLKVAGYAGLLLATPTILYEVVAYVVPGLTTSERRLLAPIVFGSGALFYAGLLFSYSVLTPAALSFFVAYADGAVESLWSIDQYFSFVLVLMASTGLAFQVPVVQILLGQAGLVSSDAMFSQWRWVVVGATVAAAVLTPSTDPFTQTLLAVPLVGLYLGGATAVRALEGRRRETA